MPQHTHPIERTLSYYDDRAKGLLSVLKEESRALEHLRTWHPDWQNASDDAIMAAPITLDDCRLVFARQHGYAGWDGFAAFVGALERNEASVPFLDALEAGKRGDLPRAFEILRAHPELVYARGSNGNSLLNLVGSMLACPKEEVVDDDAAGDGRRPGHA